MLEQFLKGFYFNPRTHKECDNNPIAEAVSSRLFQSTHSQGVRPELLNNRGFRAAISIHALTRSATYQQPYDPPSLRYFNPRTHKECDVPPLT